MRAVLLGLLFLSGCATTSGNSCVGEYATIGSRAGPNTTPGENYGKYAVVKKVYGPSRRCSDPRRPVSADVVYED